MIPNADAAAPIVNAVILPLLFLSGIFIPFGNNTPAWILWVARIFPVRHFVAGMQAGFLGTAVPLDRRPRRRRLGDRRAAGRHPVLQLGAAPGLGLAGAPATRASPAPDGRAARIRERWRKGTVLKGGHR